MYDIEQFLKDAGAERINERALISLERELQNTVKELIDEASLYANYAGRRKMINISDVELAGKGKIKGNRIRYMKKGRKMRARQARPRISVPRIAIVNSMPVIEPVPQIMPQ
ncbi:MAG: hypothetical protein KGI06_02995 [Candidatus Micrarchaeota archaeon]|nr:hypothetical protein [Candidatus Micrarchaeota archaeon]